MTTSADHDPSPWKSTSIALATAPTLGADLANFGPILKALPFGSIHYEPSICTEDTVENLTCEINNTLSGQSWTSWQCLYYSSTVVGRVAPTHTSWSAWIRMFVFTPACIGRRVVKSTPSVVSHEACSSLPSLRSCMIKLPTPPPPSCQRRPLPSD